MFDLLQTLKAFETNERLEHLSRQSATMQQSLNDLSACYARMEAKIDEGNARLRDIVQVRASDAKSLVDDKAAINDLTSRMDAKIAELTAALVALDLGPSVESALVVEKPLPKDPLPMTPFMMPIVGHLAGSGV
jgi:uncharacterized coiled-coil protein SlyX